LIQRTGKGIKGDPRKYFTQSYDIGDRSEVRPSPVPAAQEAVEEMIHEYSATN